jgi:immune inhibitor A
MYRRSLLFVVIIGAFCLSLFTPARSMPPTEDAIKQWIAQGVYQEKIDNWTAFKQAGGSAPYEHSPLLTFRSLREVGLDTKAVDTLRLIVIMVEFTDWHAADQNYSATAHDFDSLLFTDRQVSPGYNPTGSMTDFYMEGSYGTVFIVGDIYGWYMMPNTYAYYVGTDDGLSKGYVLAGDAVDAAEAAGVDFSPYANGDSWVDGVVVVHAGAGAETGVYGIWSHRSSMSTRHYDGVYINAYTMNPEEYGTGFTTMGVFAHEYGHVLSLPDLYDINDASPGDGLGNWSLMAGGSWNDNGRTPSQLDAWCKARLGFVDVVWLDNNQYQVEIPAVEYNPVVYGLRENPGGVSWEYWLVENRQHTGFDSELPGNGLCIFHFDSTVGAQNNRFRYMLAMEQADGEDDLAINGGSDGGDPFPGIKVNREFHDQSNPNSRDNDGGVTEVGVWGISNSDSIMYADLDVAFSRPWIVLTGGDSLSFTDPLPGGDGDGIIEAGETIEFNCRVKNMMRTAYGATATLSTDDETVQFIQNDVPLAADLTTYLQVQTASPVTFTIPADFESVIETFTLTITADSVSGSSDGVFSKTFVFEQTLGAPQILIVDDDAGQTFETRYVSAITALRRPSDVWDKSVSSPTGTDLDPYDILFWYTGKDVGGGTLTAGDVAALKHFLDNGGRLYLASMTAATQLQTLDSAFMADYLHADLAGTGAFGLGFIGYDGTELGDGVSFLYYGSAPINPYHDHLTAVNGGRTEFYLADDFGSGNFGDCGVSYSGAYRTLFTTFGYEFLADNDKFGFNDKDTLMQRVIQFFRTSYPYVRAFELAGDDINQVGSASPTFSWKVQDTGAATQSEYEIEVGTDLDWVTAEMWAPGAVSSSDTSVVYGGSALVAGETYYIRLRTGNGTYWSDWYEQSFHMNTAPGAPVSLIPADSQITDANPELTVLNAVDAEVSELTYEFEVYSDEALTIVEQTSAPIGGGNDSTSWTVPAALTELAQYWWRARAFDGVDYGDWSEVQTFVVNSAYEPPTGNLYVASTSVSPCDTACSVQPIVVQSSKPLTEAVIPIRIPPAVQICDVTFDGLLTETWDLNDITIDEVEGYILVTLGNSVGAQLPADTSTVCNIEFNVPVPCNVNSYLTWDTMGFAEASQQLQFTDTMEVFAPVFEPSHDSTEVVAFEPGNIDGEPSVDIGDLTYMIGYLYLGGEPACYRNAADVNGDCEGPDIGDLTRIITYLYISSEPLACGCVSSGAPRQTVTRSDIVLSAEVSDGHTDIILESSDELRGVEVSLSGSVSAVPQNLLKDRMNLITGTGGDGLKIAVVDLDGDEAIPAGRTKLFQLDGEFGVTSGEVSDMNHTVYAASLGASSDDEQLPTSFALEQNYPNPFNPTTSIRFALPTAARIKLEVFNVLGQLVVTLVDDRLEAGYHQIEWDGHGSDGTAVSSGVYLYRLESTGFTATRKMLLLK